MEYRHLFRKVEQTVSSINRIEDPSILIRQVAERILTNFQAELHLISGRIYRREGFRFILEHVFGGSKKVGHGYSIPVDYAPVQKALDEGIALMDRRSPGIDPEIEKDLGVDRFAAISVGNGSHLISFSFKGKVDKKGIYYTLNILRHAVNSKLREEMVTSLIKEARVIQESILPRIHPDYPGFDLHGISLPAESVGGDYFDYLNISDRILGLAIGDATGHGLPAALLIRDVYVGLRMGMSREFKITQTIERLNRIIGRSKLTSRFVSLFYGELETNGYLIYVNAGHNPPCLFSRGKWEHLEQKGLILGPIPEATYNRGVSRLLPGDILVLFTDGVVESTNPKGQEFGADRMMQIIQDHADESAETLCRITLDAVHKFCGSEKPDDDITLMICKRLPG